MKITLNRCVWFTLLIVSFVPCSGAPSSTNSGLWQPALNTSWQWQLSSVPKAAKLLNVGMYDVDGFDAPAALITAMHRKGIRAVCYVSVGTWEDWRPDAASFPAVVKGKGNGWPGEKWLDIRAIDILAPIMTARFELCKNKGFDAVEPDNVDGYSNKTGFPLTAAQQLTYNRWIASTVHSFGMSVALKNDVAQVKALLPYFDFAINEECFTYNECNLLKPFIAANKAVFEVEYGLSKAQFCSQANALNFNAMRKTDALTAYRVACR